jgi:hypothetical protein
LGAQVHALPYRPVYALGQFQQAPAQKQGKLVSLGLHRTLYDLAVRQVQQTRGTGLHQGQRHLPLWKNHGGWAQ